MIKAEVITEDNGYEVPNWLSKCKDALLSPPTMGAVTVLLLLAIGVFAFHGRSKGVQVNETGVQSQPSTTSSLQVASPSSEIPATASSVPTALTVPSGSNPSTGAAGPAPTTSLGSLQPTGTTQRPGGLSQALDQTIQSAGNATSGMRNGLGL